MSNSRRDFFKNSSLATGAFLFHTPFKKISTLAEKSAGLRKESNTVTIFHTNDLHNQIEPLTEGKLKGYGGINSIKSIVGARQQKLILVDGGDFLDDQLTKEAHLQMIQYMNEMGYHAAAIGNREIANGQEYLAVLAGAMKFKLVNCNYALSHPLLKKLVTPYHITSWGYYKIGIIGVGPELSAQLKTAEGIEVQQPYAKATSVASYLKHKHRCDMVICLSHLGLNENANEYNNNDFARNSEDIDIIISGHHNTLAKEPIVLRNANKKQVLISHGGWGGLVTRQITMTFSTEGNMHSLEYRNYAPSTNKVVSFHKAFKEFT